MPAGVAIDPAHVAIGGFSDGASCALSLGLVNGDLFTHVMAFSPGLVVADEGPWLRKAVHHPVGTGTGGTTESVLSSVDASIVNQSSVPRPRRAAIGTKGAS